MKCLLLATLIFLAGCGASVVPSPKNGAPPPENPVENTGEPASFPQFQFVEVGQEIGPELIDLQQLPDHRWLAASRDGDLFLVSEGFQVLSTVHLDEVDRDTDDGLENIEIAPDFAESGEVFVYFTPGYPDSQPPCDSVRCTRLEKLALDLSSGIEVLSKNTVITLQDPGTLSGHDGGAMAFAENGDLFLTTGDGDVAEQFPPNPQDDASLLGKVLRIQPSGTVEVYAKGLRNPFTMTAGLGGLFIADVGADTYEEIDFARAGGMNFGWPLSEGPTALPGITPPLHGYAHDDPTFLKEDPDNPNPVPNGPFVVIAGVFYSGGAYEGVLDNSLLYGEFYQGWIRALQVNPAGEKLADRHVAHFPGITAMKTGADGAVYAVSLFGSRKILRLETRPSAAFPAP